MKKYFQEIEDKIKVCYSIAGEARSKGLDPLDKVEIPLARTLAEKVVGLISTVYPQINDERIVKRIIELEKEYGYCSNGSLKAAGYYFMVTWLHSVIIINS